MQRGERGFGAVVVGTSAGGLAALTTLLSGIPAQFSLPMLVVQHRSKQETDLLEMVLQKKCDVKIKQADEKELIRQGTVYIAPPDYHLLVENNHALSLSIDAAVNFSRPSIDVLFESASVVFKERLIAIVLTGANDDGADGIRSVAHRKGVTIAQNPREAVYDAMPKAAIETGAVQHILTLKEIQEFLIRVEKIERL